MPAAAGATRGAADACIFARALRRVEQTGAQRVTHQATPHDRRASDDRLFAEAPPPSPELAGAPSWVAQQRSDVRGCASLGALHRTRRIGTALHSALGVTQRSGGVSARMTAEARGG